MILAVVIAYAWILAARWLAPSGLRLARPRNQRDFLVVLLATAGAALIGAALRATGLGLLPMLDAEAFLLLTIRNYSGILGPTVLGALLLPYLGSGGGHEFRRALLADGTRHASRVVEVLVMLAVGAAFASVVFADDPRSLAFALVLLVVWSAFRLPALGAVAYALVLGTLGVLATIDGRGQFQSDDAFEGAAIAQAFLITLVLAALAIAIDVEERRAATERARSAEQEAESRATLFSTVGTEGRRSA